MTRLSLLARRILPRTLVAALVVALVAGLALAPAVHAQSGAKPITLMVPTSSATAADITSRLIQPILQQRLNAPVIVENRTGASGAIGMAAVVRAAPDGNTVLMSPSTMAMINLLQKDLAWNPSDFAPVARMASLYYCVVVNPALPVNNINDLIALAKREPGKINFSTPGLGTPHHLVTELFKQVTGVNVVHIPYKSSANAVTDLAGGQVQFAFQALHSVLPLVKAGKLKLIATVTDARTPWTPETPTLKESGIDGVVINSWIGAFLPKGAPKEMVDRYARELNDVLNQPAIKDELLKSGIVVNFGGPDEMAALLRRDQALWKRVVEDGRVKLD